MKTAANDESHYLDEPEIAEITASIRRLSALMTTIAEAGGRETYRSVPAFQPPAPPAHPPGPKTYREAVAALRVRLENAAERKQRDEINAIMAEIGQLVAPSGPAPAYSPARPPPPTEPRGLSTGMVLFLVANAMLATATVTSIAWYIFQSAAVGTNRSLTSDPTAVARDPDGWRAPAGDEGATMQQEPPESPALRRRR